MLLVSGDNYAKKVVLAYAKGDFSEAEKNDIYLAPEEVERVKEFYSYLVKEYHLTE
jgi:hypothetical protein